MGGSLFQNTGGLYLRGAMTTSDLLRNYRHYLNVTLTYNGTFHLLDTDTTYSFINTKNRLHYGFSTYLYRYSVLFRVPSSHLPVDQPLNLTNVYGGYIEKRYQLEGFVFFPLNKYNRLEFSFLPAWRERSLLNLNKSYSQSLVETGILNLYGKLAFPMRTAYVHDSTLLGFLHPIDNERSYISVEFSPPLGTDFFSYSKIFFDLRKYFLITRKSSFAMRLMTGALYGRDKKELQFELGGNGIYPNDPHLRGFGFRTIQGTTMHLLNVEYRTALLEFAKFFFPLPVILENINGVIFYDIGTAYDDLRAFEPWEIKDRRLIYRDIRASFGVGLRWLLIIFPLKVDLARQHTGNRLKGWQASFVIGWDF